MIDKDMLLFHAAKATECCYGGGAICCVACENHIAGDTFPGTKELETGPCIEISPADMLGIDDDFSFLEAVYFPVGEP